MGKATFGPCNPTSMLRRVARKRGALALPKGHAMPYRRVTPLFPVALSANSLADCLGIHRTKVLAAINSGELPVYKKAMARRILVEDAVRWIKTTWELQKPKGKSNGPTPGQD